MSFETTLNELVDGIDGALGAMFLDWEGEAVQIVGEPPVYDLQLVGAYQGIFLSQFKRMTEVGELGELLLFKIGFDGSVFYNCALADGYFLSLVTLPEALEGLVWQRLTACREILNREIV